MFYETQFRMSINWNKWSENAKKKIASLWNLIVYAWNYFINIQMNELWIISLCLLLYITLTENTEDTHSTVAACLEVSRSKTLVYSRRFKKLHNASKHNCTTLAPLKLYGRETILLSQFFHSAKRFVATMLCGLTRVFTRIVTNKTVYNGLLFGTNLILI